MNFLEAKRIVSGEKPSKHASLLLMMSGFAGVLPLFVSAHGRRAGLDLEIDTLPFGTLSGTIATSAARDGAREILLLLPWDLAPELDWRSGVPTRVLNRDQITAAAAEVAAALKRRNTSATIYIDAPVPPVFSAFADTQHLAAELRLMAQNLNAQILPPETFALGTYLSSGCPVSGQTADTVATAFMRALSPPDPSKYKLLVTDLDNTLWAGVVGEDGIEGIEYRPEGVGYRHFIYQSLLARLKGVGVLLAIVTRNDTQLVDQALSRVEMALSRDDFVTVMASYESKSAQVKALAERLNLGKDSIVYVDDNPVEIAEMRASLPQVTCLTVPTADEDFPDFLNELAALFSRSSVTAEDAKRTQLYKQRLDIPAVSGKGADITDFLKSLDMEIIIRDRNAERTRAVQLINKTNQFNLNGARVSDEEVAKILVNGGALLTAELTDRSGSHGEIISFLMENDGTVPAFVMSCRVFQRRVEHAFLSWVLSKKKRTLKLNYVETPRNEPARMFVDDPALTRIDNTTFGAEPDRYLAAHGSDLSLFRIRAE